MTQQQRHVFSVTGLVAMLVFAGCSGGNGGGSTGGSNPPPPPPPLPSLRVSDINVVEGNSGTSDAVFPVELSAAAAATVTVGYATRDGSALAGSDYTASSGSLSFAPGETSKTVTVAVQGDTLDEPNEQFFLTLTNPTGATLGVSEARATLVNDDGPSGLDSRPANTSCVAPARPVVGGASIALQDAFPGLSFASPLAMLQAPGDSSRWYVIEKTGGMDIIGNLSGTPTKTALADLSSLVDARSEGGLLGMAFHPNYAQNGHIYLSYTTSDNAGSDNGANFRSRISRFTLTGGGSALDPASERNVLTLAQPYDNHNGGQIAFGPDGYLYIGFGDGGSGGDPQGNGQNTRTLLGAMLRIDVNVTDPEYAAGTHYKIPADNPFAASSGCGAGSCPEIYAWGLRNPWRWSFDRATGDLWAGDVGQDAWEEIDRIERGGNYGWNIREGAHCYSAASCSIAGLIDPVAEYAHTSTNGRCSVTGGYVYRGSAMPALQGTYLYGDFCTGEIWGLGSQSGATPQLLAGGALSLASFAEGHDGELYALGYGGGAHIYRITSGTPAPAFPGRLSESGCVNPANPAEPAGGLIAYDINVPFWSDGAIKERYLALPDGNTLHINAGHDWDFPIGSVFMKHFRLGGRLIETRLFMRHPDGEWGGYSYEWNDAQTDATLVSGGKTKTISGQTWRYPSGSECLRCHSAAAGRALGPETAQMNRYFTYPGTGRSANQLSTLDFIGMFDVPLADIPANLPALAVVTDGNQTLTARARAYLHANCANCHRPGGPTPVNLDFRHTTSLSGTNACDVAPVNGDLGVADARLIAPGDPARSVLPLRMRATDSNRMPPLASSVVDGDGAALIESWIASLTGCQ